MRRFKPPEQPITPEEALQYAVRALSARALTESELERKLKQRLATPETIAVTLERLRQHKFVNDAAIAQRAAHDTSLGKFGVKRKLLARGLNQHLVEEALQTRDPELDLQAALETLERHSSKIKGERGKARAIGLLMRRGFAGDVVMKALQLRGEDTDWLEDGL
jgi:regulatory protein